MNNFKKILTLVLLVLLFFQKSYSKNETLTNKTNTSIGTHRPFAESICIFCLVDISAKLDALNLVPATTETNPRSIVLLDNKVISTKSGPAIINDSKYIVANKNFFSYLKRTEIGHSFFDFLEKNSLSLKMFYQFGIKQNGKTISDSSVSSSHFNDNIIPHEFWSFFSSDGTNATIYLNEYQEPFMANYSLVHEMTHLLDSATQKYIAKYIADFSELDKISLEVRALIAEIQFDQQYKKLELKIGTDESQFTYPERDYSQFYKKNEINYQTVVDYVLNLRSTKISGSLLYPTLEYVHDINGLHEITPTLTKTTLEDLLAQFNSFNQNPSEYDFVIISYKKQKASESKIVTDEQNSLFRKQLNEKLKSRGYSNLTDYLSAEGLLNTVFNWRKDGHYNQIPELHGGPSVRGGGGGGGD